MMPSPNNRVLITGGTGLLASELAVRFSEAGKAVWAPSHADLDVADAAATMAACREWRPSQVIHAAAMSSVAACEANRRQAWIINVLGTEHMLRAAQVWGAQLVFISSTGLFAAGAPVDETAQPLPVTWYHATKYIAERRVIEYAAHLVIRTTWLYGGNAEQPRNWIARRVEDLAAAQNPLGTVHNRWGSPTWTRDVADAIHRLTERGATGVFHVVNAGQVTRYEWLKTVLESLNVPEDRIRPICEDLSTAGPGPVPSNESAVSCRLASHGIAMRNWRDALREYIDANRAWLLAALKGRG
jgi:dTDP-4-dehydrorhamnose reductase